MLGLIYLTIRDEMHSVDGLMGEMSYGANREHTCVHTVMHVY